MHILEAIKVLSPLDVVILTLENQTLVKKSELDECLPASFLVSKVEKFIQLGEFPTRNVTYWNVSEGKTKEETEDWNEKLIKELTSSKMSVKVQELDNTKNIVEVSCEIYLIVHNCSQLTKELLKEVKCARIHTAFGQIDVEI